MVVGDFNVVVYGADVVGCCCCGYGKYEAGKKRREWSVDGAWLKKQSTKGFPGKKFVRFLYQRVVKQRACCLFTVLGKTKHCMKNQIKNGKRVVL